MATEMATQATLAVIHAVQPMSDVIAEGVHLSGENFVIHNNMLYQSLHVSLRV